jgi:hypothetical protein
MTTSRFVRNSAIDELFLLTRDYRLSYKTYAAMIKYNLAPFK